jgi:hypothetical protein
MELDTSKSFKELTELLKDGNVPVKVTPEFASANAAVGLQGAASLFEEAGAMDTLLGLATTVSPSARLEGLKAIKKSLGC